MDAVEMAEVEIRDKCLAIVCFGPATPVSGNKAGEYYQVTIDPNMCSPKGDYIRFGAYQGDEINGWQRVASLTIVENLGPSEAQLKAALPGYTVDAKAKVRMRSVV